MDKRKFNGNKGHSTKSTSKFDRRKTGNFEDSEVVEIFLDKIKLQMLDFYKRGFTNKINSISDDGFYVYAHFYNGVVVYVGKGSGNRVYSKNRNFKEHTELIEQGFIEFNVLSKGMTNDVALMVEKLMIEFYQPMYNTAYIL